MNLTKAQRSSIKPSVLTSMGFYALPYLLISLTGSLTVIEIVVGIILYPIPFISLCALLSIRHQSKTDFENMYFGSYFIGGLASFISFIIVLIASGYDDATMGIPNEIFLLILLLLVIGPTFIFGWLFDLHLKKGDT